MHALTIVGLLLSCILICARRFAKKMPDWLYTTGLILGIAAMIAGLILSRT